MRQYGEVEMDLFERRESMEPGQGSVYYEETPEGFVMERMGKIRDLDRSFDILFWQAQDTTARFRAAWDLVVHYHRRRGGTEDELRLQRTVERLQRQPR